MGVLGTHHYIRRIDVISAFHSRQWCKTNTCSFRWEGQKQPIRMQNKKAGQWCDLISSNRAASTVLKDVLQIGFKNISKDNCHKGPRYVKKNKKEKKMATDTTEHNKQYTINKLDMLLHVHLNLTTDATMLINLNCLKYFSLCYSHGTTEELRFFSLLHSFWALKHSTNLALHWVTNCTSRTKNYFFFISN